MREYILLDRSELVFSFAHSEASDGKTVGFSLTPLRCQKFAIARYQPIRQRTLYTTLAGS
jgi:hypothetical protein